MLVVGYSRARRCAVVKLRTSSGLLNTAYPNGATVSSPVNSKSMSSFGEFMDDVVNLAVLKNFLQVDGYNYIANAGTKRPLDPVGYAGLLSTLEDTCKLFNQNGVLATGLTYDDPITGDETVAPFGYAV